ncbi:inhibitor of apoptosis repeat-containing protein, partial [Amylostereum chailletii]
MEAFQARLETFFKAKRVKNGTGKRTISVKWPHPDTITATPSALAEAGFYYDPSWDDQDNVSCFMCDKELAGWEEDDDPFQIHWEKCRDSCAWAIVRCGLDGDVDRKGKFVFKDGSRIPNGKQMEKARLTTFTTRSWWPHDTTKGHGASSTKMAKAGFVYTPSSAGDDNATCLYCNVSLGGWDEDDDPL